MTTWKEVLKERMPADWSEEIDLFEGQMELRRQDRFDEKVFAETRLRRGAYGQRYDNGKRHDGETSQPLSFPCGDLVKGPDTVWDAPGMMRIKIPYGLLTPEQIETLADLSEEYADGISHITTRQDVQLHFVHIDDTPTLMRRLAAVGITTREACGNSVRNVTACHEAGICQDETFDVTPYADALTYYLLGHDDVQGFGRKFKIAFSGCAHRACGLVTIHDLGFVAKTQDGSARLRRVHRWRPRRRAPHRPAVHRLFARSGAHAHVARGVPGVCAPRREAQPRQGPDEIRAEKARPRRAAARRRRRTQGAARRPALDGVPSRAGHAASSPRSSPLRASCDRRPPRRPPLTTGVATNARAQKPGRLQHGHHHLPARRSQRPADALRRRRGAQLHAGHGAHHRRAKLRAPLGERR